MKTLRWLCMLTFTVGCLNVRPVDLPPKLAAPEDPVKAGVRGIKVAVVNFVPPPDVQVEGGGGDAPTAMKESTPPPPVDPNPRTRVSFTPKYQETYPTLTHMGQSIPAALQEQGFDVFTVSSTAEARHRGAQYVLHMLPPEMEGFRRADGGGVRLEGTVYDVHVTYRAEMSPILGASMGVMSGHGEATTNFFFDDRYLETAVVGSISLAVMAVTTIAFAVPLGAAFYVRRGAPEPVGNLCNAAQLKGTGAPVGVCQQTVWLMAGVAAISFLAASASLTLGLAQLVGSTLFASITAAIKSQLSEPRWEGMLKTAHDRAARSLAERVVAVVNQPGNAGGTPGRTP